MRSLLFRLAPFSSPFFCQSPLSLSPPPLHLLEARVVVYVVVLVVRFFGGSTRAKRRKRKRKKKKKPSRVIVVIRSRKHHERLGPLPALDRGTEASENRAVWRAVAG